MPNTYRFTLTANSISQVVRPVWGNNPSKVLEREDGFVFHRETYSFTLSFLRNDFTFISDQPIETEFTLLVEVSKNGAAYVTDFTAYFTKLDCRFFPSDNRVEVQPIVLDQYENVMAGMNKTFNLIDLNPDRTSFQYKKQPIIQLYLFGSNYITNLVGQTYWETPVLDNSINSVDLVNIHKFNQAATFNLVTGSLDSLSPDVSGRYANITLLREDGKYQIVDQSGTWKIIDKTDSDNVVYSGVAGESPFPQPGHSGRILQGTIFTSVTDASSKCRLFTANLFIRYLTDLETTVTGTTDPVPDPDITPPIPGYDRVIGWPSTDFAFSDKYQDTPTVFGKLADDAVNGAGKYFSRPDISNSLSPFYDANAVDFPFPVNTSDWTEVSVWFYFTTSTKSIQEDASTTITIKDAYKLSEVIRVLLNEIDPALTHLGNGDHSQFLYTENTFLRPGPPFGQQLYPIISPRSNVLVGDYDKAAQRADIKLADVLEMLRIVYNAYWHIEGGKFIIEHVSYYYNGKKYGGPNVQFDTGSIYEPKTELPWNYKADSYSYEKEKVPERIEFFWPDVVSLPFRAWHMQFTSLYVDKGNIDSREIPLFYADIDFALVNASEISPEGFFIFDCHKTGSIYYAPFLEYTVLPGYEFKMQNGYLSFVFAIDKYHRYDLPSRIVEFNLVLTVAATIRRSRIQEIELPELDLDPMQLMNSLLGTAQIDRIQTNLESRALTVKLRHDTI